MKNKTDKKITVKDIASLAKVSAGTVDRVLHNRGEVSKKTKDKINEIIQKYDFKRDMIASTLASKKKYNFVTILPFPTKEILYWELPKLGIENAFNEIKYFGVKHIQYNFNYSDSKEFITQSKKALLSNPDGILIAPVLHKEAAAFINSCNEKKIPVVTIDALIPNTNVLSYIGQNSFQTGLLAARLMNIGEKGAKEYLIVNISQNKDSYIQLRERTNGFKSYFKSNSNVRINEIDIENNDEKTIEKNIISRIKKDGRINGIFVSNSRVYKIASVIEKHKIENIRLIGYDLLDDNISFLKKGTIDFLISQKPEEQAYKGIMTLFNHLVLKREIVKLQFLPIDIIMKENIDYYKFHEK